MQLRGVDFDESLGALVIDHASYVVLNTDSDHTLLCDYSQDQVIEVHFSSLF